MSQFHSLKIGDIHKATDSCVVITFEVPEQLKSAFRFKAGQYLAIKTHLDGNEIRRDYSICSSPNSGKLQVAVKAVKGGYFSNFANTVLKAGDTLEVAAPNGRFVFEPNALQSRTIMAFAAGSGITPVMSIMKTLLEEEPASTFVLMYGNKSPEDTIFFSEIEQLKTQYNDRLKVHYVFSQVEMDNALFGRIEKSTANFILKNYYGGTAIDQYYLCGPEPMIHAIKDMLLDQGTNSLQIHFELFAVTTPAKPLPEDMLPEGKTKVTVILDDEETSFVMDPKKSVLEAALAENLDPPYSCQGGICSSCLARLKEGEVKMRQNNILTDSEVEEGLILTCQSHPITPSIKVDYDDV